MYDIGGRIKVMYEIWSSGYMATGEDGSSIVTYHGKINANSFREACQLFANNNNEFRKYYDVKQNTFYGCKLHQSKKEAEIYNIKHF